jgi:hypothetical protein
MKTHWFKNWGFVHRPIAWPGWLAWALGAIISLNVFRALDRHANSVSDLAYQIFPYFVAVFLLLEWLAGKTRGNP